MKPNNVLNQRNIFTVFICILTNMILSEVLINGVTWLLKLKYTVSCITNACNYVNVPEVIQVMVT